MTDAEKCPRCERLYPGSIAHFCPDSQTHIIIDNIKYCEICHKELITTDERKEKLCEGCLNKSLQSISNVVPEMSISGTERHKLTIYLAGPMTGKTNYNIDEFIKYKEKYINLGFNVISPTDIDNGETGKDYNYYIKHALEMFIKNNLSGIYLLPDWNKSKGAKLEKHIADVLGIKVFDAETGELWHEDLLDIIVHTCSCKSNETETFKTGAVRQTGVVGSKLARYDLLMETIGMRRLAATYGEGAIKYGDNNWKHGIPNSNLLNHTIAHLHSWSSGDRTEDHLAHAAWGLFAIMEFEERPIQLTDPFPKNEI